MTTVAATSSSQPSAKFGAQAAPAISSDFQTFLRMLTTQMQNQDPLNPIESTDFAVQLATFSGVEQQVRTNELLASLQSALGYSGLDRFASWVGKEALVTAPVAFDGTPVTLAPVAAQGADRAELVVTDAAGAVVSREPLPLPAGRIDWVGTDAAGRPLPPGLYSLAVDSFIGEEAVGTGPVAAYRPVSEIRATADGVVIVVPGGTEVPVGDVAALRDAADR